MSMIGFACLRSSRRAAVSRFCREALRLFPWALGGFSLTLFVLDRFWAHLPLATFVRALCVTSASILVLMGIVPLSILEVIRRTRR